MLASLLLLLLLLLLGATFYVVHLSGMEAGVGFVATWVSVALAVLGAAFGLFLKLFSEEIKVWLQARLGSAGLRWTLVATCAAVAFLLLTTSSVHLVYDAATASEREFSVELRTASGGVVHRARLAPRLEAVRFVDWLRRTGRVVELRLVEPLGFEPRRERQLPGSRLALHVPADFRAKTYRAVGLVPGSWLFQLLPNADGPEEGGFKLEVEHRGVNYAASDVRRGVVLAGASERELEALLESDSYAALRDRVADYLAKEGVADERRPAILEALFSRPRVLGTPEFAPGDAIRARVRCEGTGRIVSEELRASVPRSGGILLAVLEGSYDERDPCGAG